MPVFSSGSPGEFESSPTEKVSLIKVDSNISIVDFRAQLIAQYKAKNIEVDHIKGKVFRATAISKKSMIPVGRTAELKSKFPTRAKEVSSKILHFAIGARGADFDPTEQEPNPTLGSQSLEDQLRNPPQILAQRTAKQTIADDNNVTLQARNYVHQLYFNSDSNFYHGFTNYHAQMMINTVRDNLKRGNDMRTDTDNGVWPDKEKWGDFCTTASWADKVHEEGTLGLDLERGKYPPKSKDRSQIPTAADCKIALSTRAAAAGTTAAGSSNAGGGSKWDTVNGYLNFKMRQEAKEDGQLNPMAAADPRTIRPLKRRGRFGRCRSPHEKVCLFSHVL